MTAAGGGCNPGRDGVGALWELLTGRVTSKTSNASAGEVREGGDGASGDPCGAGQGVDLLELASIGSERTL
jgi:hypothetical protein